MTAQCRFQIAAASPSGVALAALWNCQADTHDCGPNGQDGHELPPNAVAAPGAKWVSA